MNIKKIISVLMTAVILVTTIVTVSVPAGAYSGYNYSLLNKEYKAQQKVPVNLNDPSRYSSEQTRGFIKGNLLVFYDTEEGITLFSNAGKCGKMYIYNIKTKKKSKFSLDGLDGTNGIFYYDNAFYFFGEKIVKTNVKGKVLKTLDVKKSDPDNQYDTAGIMLSDGTIAIRYYDKKGKYYFSLYSKDLKLKKNIKAPTMKNPHGKAVDIDKGGYMFEYNNRLCLEAKSPDSYSDYCIFYLDLKTYKWTKGKTLSKKIDRNLGKIAYNSLDDYSAVDITTGESADFSKINTLMKNYHGGKYSTLLLNSYNSGKWEKYWIHIAFTRYNVSSNLNSKEIAERLGNESADILNITCVNDTYYLVKDEYGIFLRKYATGEKWEQEIVSF